MFLELSLGLEIYFLDSEEVDLWRRTWLFRIVWIIISLPGNLWIVEPVHCRLFRRGSSSCIILEILEARNREFEWNEVA